MQLVVDTLAPGGRELAVNPATIEWLYPYPDGSPQPDTIHANGMAYARLTGSSIFLAGVTPASGLDNQNFGQVRLVVIPRVSGSRARTHVLTLQRSTPISASQRREAIARLRGAGAGSSRTASPPSAADGGSAARRSND